ncbi:hypothetical protein D3C73_1238790 [compost metagenome]
MRGRPDAAPTFWLGMAADVVRPAPWSCFAQKTCDVIVAETDGELAGSHPGVSFEVEAGACLYKHDCDSEMAVPRGVVQGGIAVVGALSVDIERPASVAMLHQKPRNISMPHISGLMSCGGAHQAIQ